MPSALRTLNQSQSRDIQNEEHAEVSVGYSASDALPLITWAECSDVRPVGMSFEPNLVISPR